MGALPGVATGNRAHGAVDAHTRSAPPDGMTRMAISGAGQGMRRESFGLGAIMAEGLLSRLSFGVISFALPLYARRLGISLTDIGILIGLNGAIAIAIKPLCGWATDRYGPRRILLTAVALRSVVSLLLVFAVSLGHLYAIRALHGVAMGLRDPAAGVLLAGGAEKRVASRFAWYQSAKQMGGNLGRSVAGLLIGLTASRYSLVFLAAFALSSLPLIAVFLSVHDPADDGVKPSAAAAASPAASRSHMRARVFAYAGLGVLVAGTANMLTQLFPLIATEYAHLTPGQAGMVFLVGSVVGVVGGPVFGWLADHVGPRHRQHRVVAPVPRLPHAGGHRHREGDRRPRQGRVPPGVGLDHGERREGRPQVARPDHQPARHGRGSGRARGTPRRWSALERVGHRSPDHGARRARGRQRDLRDRGLPAGARGPSHRRFAVRGRRGHRRGGRRLTSRAGFLERVHREGDARLADVGHRVRAVHPRELQDARVRDDRARERCLTPMARTPLMLRS
jgi:MFS family permease